MLSKRRVVVYLRYFRAPKEHAEKATVFCKPKKNSKENLNYMLQRVTNNLYYKVKYIKGDNFSFLPSISPMIKSFTPFTGVYIAQF